MEKPMTARGVIAGAASAFEAAGMPEWDRDRWSEKRARYEEVR
jgi:hypothetical protein